jgi:hypothetical protein
LFGVIPGKTTVEEMKRIAEPKFGDRAPYYVVRGIKFWYDEKTQLVTFVRLKAPDNIPRFSSELFLFLHKQSHRLTYSHIHILFLNIPFVVTKFFSRWEALGFSWEKIQKLNEFQTWFRSTFPFSSTFSVTNRYRMTLFSLFFLSFFLSLSLFLSLFSTQFIDINIL